MASESGSAQSSIAAVQAAFKALSLPLGEVVQHEVVETVDKHKAVKNLPAGTLAKNLFLKDKKNKFYLVTVKADANVNLGELGKTLVRTYPLSGFAFTQPVLSERVPAGRHWRFCAVCPARPTESG